MQFQALIPWLVQEARQWVESQRNQYRPNARSLTEPERTGLGRFFDPEYLELARIAWGPVVKDPPFYPALQNLGLRFPFSELNGITYVDTIYLVERGGVRDPPSPHLLFHELVHVVQYKTLGVEQFLSRYVQGYLERDQDYTANPLEAHAYELQRRYESAPTIGFSVAADVHRMSNAY